VSACRRFLVVGLALVALGVAACSDGSDDGKTAAGPSPGSAAGGAPVFTMAGFSDHTGASNNAPADVTAPGGTMRSCNPTRLYAFINFSNLQPPKQFVGSWTLNGAFLNQQAFNQDRTSAQSFFEVQNTPTPLTAGAYRFQLRIDNNVVTEGSFTLAC
jgi:hypothetical protein